MLREGGSDASFCGCGCGVIDVRIRKDGRPDNGGIERSLAGCLEAAIALSESNGVKQEAAAEERERGRDGGSMDMVRERVLLRASVLLVRNSWTCLVGTGMETETEEVVVGWLKKLG
jgi:hypothetical protein